MVPALHLIILPRPCTSFSSPGPSRHGDAPSAFTSPSKHMFSLQWSWQKQLLPAGAGERRMA